MTVDPDGVIKRFNILKNKPISMPVVQDIETVEPFSFNQRMKRFDAGIIIRISAMRITALHIFCGLAPGIRNILTATVAMYD